MLSSGEVAWQGLRDRKAFRSPKSGRRCFLISRDQDRGVVGGLDLELVELEAADFILLAGLDDDQTDFGAWRDRLAAAAARKLPMFCANPDITMFSAVRAAARRRARWRRPTRISAARSPISASRTA